MKLSRKNSEGYMDLTAYKALTGVVKTENRIRISEAQIQAALFEWAAWEAKRYPELWFLYAIPNGGSRHPAEAANLKRQGVKAGVSDVCLPVARGGYHGMYLELKAAGGKISKLQAEWINQVREQGYFAVVAYGFDEAKGLVERYLGM